MKKILTLVALLIVAVTGAACGQAPVEVTAGASPTVQETAPVTISAPPSVPETTLAPTTTTTAPTTTTAAPTTTVYVAPTTRYVPPTTRPAPKPTTTVKVAASSGTGSAFLDCVKQRESRGNYAAVNSSSGAGGAYQFMPSTWQAMGFASKYGVSSAQYASPAQQDEAARITLAQVGTSPWAGPGC